MPNSTAVRPKIPAYGQISSPSKKSAGRGLGVRFVTRMTADLDKAIATAARQDGLTAGAWVRRILLERVALDSPRDAKSGRPIRKPGEYDVAIGAAIRELGAVSAAVSTDDRIAAKAGLDRARAVLIPLVVGRASP
jgi:hypothetical protein